MRDRWSGSKILTMAGILLMVVGVLLVLAALHVQNNCLTQQGRINGEDLQATQAACSYALPLGMSYLALALGAGTIVLGVLTSTLRWRKGNLPSSPLTGG